MTFFGVTMFDPSQNIAKWKGLSENTLPSIIRWFVFMFAIKNASTCYIPVIYPPFSHTHTPKKQAEQMPGGGSLQSPPADPDGGLARIWPQQMRRLDLWKIQLQLQHFDPYYTAEWRSFSQAPLRHADPRLFPWPCAWPWCVAVTQTWWRRRRTNKSTRLV